MTTVQEIKYVTVKTQDNRLVEFIDAWWDIKDGHLVVTSFKAKSASEFLPANRAEAAFAPGHWKEVFNESIDALHRTHVTKGFGAEFAISLDWFERASGPVPSTAHIPVDAVSKQVVPPSTAIGGPQASSEHMGIPFGGSPTVKDCTFAEGGAVSIHIDPNSTPEEIERSLARLKGSPRVGVDDKPPTMDGLIPFNSVEHVADITDQWEEDPEGPPIYAQDTETSEDDLRRRLKESGIIDDQGTVSPGSGRSHPIIHPDEARPTRVYTTCDNCHQPIYVDQTIMIDHKNKKHYHKGCYIVTGSGYNNPRPPDEVPQPRDTPESIAEERP